MSSLFASATTSITLNDCVDMCRTHIFCLHLYQSGKLGSGQIFQNATNHIMLRRNAKVLKMGIHSRLLRGKSEKIEAEFNADLLLVCCRNLVVKIKVQGPWCGTLPSELSESMVNDEAFLKTVHHILLEVRLIEGTLVCPESGRKFPVKNSIPNMLLNEDEV